MQKSKLAQYEMQNKEDITMLECLNCGKEQMYIRNPSFTHRDRAFINCFNCSQNYYIYIPSYIPNEQIWRYLNAKV